MRPNKPINQGAHRSGSAAGKNRYFVTGLPEPHADDADSHEEPVRRLDIPVSFRRDVAESAPTKYEGRSSVGPAKDDQSVTIDLKHEEWVDPLDTEEQVDLTRIEIDLRETMRDDAPDTYYQRFGTRIPGRE